MYKFIVAGLVLLATLGHAQGRKPVQKSKAAAPVVKDSVRADTTPVKLEPEEIPKEFKVYTRKPRTKKERVKLCLNLVSGDSILNYCMNDSVCRDPEKYKILFEQKNADSTYVLVFVDAFSKAAGKPECDAGHETKLFFVRWNTVTNKAIVRPKTISSCIKGITNMTREPIEDWDGSGPLIINYYKGMNNFSELKFDPQNYLQGFQMVNDSEGK